MSRARSIQNAVLATAIAAELLFLIGHFVVGWGPSHRRAPATPATLTIGTPPSPRARSLLLSLARTAARATPPGTGRYAYVSLQSWALADQHGSGASSHPLYSSVESWRADDGSGRQVVAQRTKSGYTTTTATLTPSASRRPIPLTGDQVAIAHRLHLGYPSHEPLAEQFTVFADVYASEPVPPAPRAAMLRLLARVPTVLVAGNTTDRLGRRGVAVTIDSTASGTLVRDTLVFDRRTGALLESDRTLAGDSNGLGVPSGALLAYTVIRDSGRVDAAGTRPR